MNKKDLTPEEILNLMDVAKQPLKKPIRKKLSGASRSEAAHSVEQVRQFIEDEKIGADTVRLPIPAMLIYNRYLQWCKTNYETSIPYLNFFKKFRLFFNMKKIGGETHYEVYPVGFDTSPQHKQFVKNEVQKKIKSKIKKS